jgi:vacuolar-type H+-ATPase subunit H
MPQTIESTVKALTDFEAELDRLKGEALEAKKKMVKDASDWAEAAKGSAMAEAQKIASQRLSEARREAEGEASEIRKKGQAATKKFEESISKHKNEAADSVLRRLLGEER